MSNENTVVKAAQDDDAFREDGMTLIYKIMSFAFGMPMVIALFLKWGHAATGLPKLWIAPFAILSGWAVVYFLLKLFFPKKKA